ncbi:MAG: NADH-quinone oxidoreductase subunit H [Candidatus Omnitrophica bacterium]|nr:NADH-quinone oxidoreductase subunit H [Candidatus Omnitrophota bacterium]
MIGAIALLARFAACVLFSPFLLGVIAKTKAFFAGRKGPPLLQPYYDISKQIQKASVYSLTTTWIFRISPLVSLTAILVSSLLIPLGSLKAPIQFGGDVILFAYLFGLARFFTMLAAMDTGSSFEGMGASREAAFSCLSELAFFMNLAALAILSKSFSLSQMIGERSWALWSTVAPSLILVAASYFMILLVENARIPIDDPATHLELTMIHEVMVLDHSGPDFAFILYGGALKLFVLGSFLITLLIPFQFHHPVMDAAVFLAGMTGLAVLIGVVESVVARLRLNRIASFIVISFVLALLGLIIALSRIV